MDERTKRLFAYKEIEERTGLRYPAPCYANDYEKYGRKNFPYSIMDYSVAAKVSAEVYIFTPFYKKDDMRKLLARNLWYVERHGDYLAISQRIFADIANNPDFVRLATNQEIANVKRVIVAITEFYEECNRRDLYEKEAYERLRALLD